MKRVLMVASVASIIKQFNMNNIEILHNLGYKVDVACNFEQGNTISGEAIKAFQDILKSLDVDYYQIDFSRSPKDFRSHRFALQCLNELFEKNKYDFAHCHSPLSSILGRESANRHAVKVIYTAHGFHFFKGSPLANWLFFPLEAYFARFTDCLITINEEDYQLARRFFRAKKIVKVPGVGVNIDRFHTDQSKRFFRNELAIPKDKFVVLSVGELSTRKNHICILKALRHLSDPDIHYLIVGQGEEKDTLLRFALKNNMKEQVHLLGYREDVEKYFFASDVFAFPSKREGLGLAAIEAMAAGMPIVTSNINGINDYSTNGYTGFSYAPNDFKGFARGIATLKSDNELVHRMGQNCKSLSKDYDISRANEIMRDVYSGFDK